MLQPPAESAPPAESGESRIRERQAVERILERNGTVVFAHAQPYRRLLVTHRPDVENPRTGATLADMLTLPVLRHEDGSFTWGAKPMQGLAQFASAGPGDETLKMGTILDRMQACTDDGGLAGMIWAGERPPGDSAPGTGRLELYLGSGDVDEGPLLSVPPLALEDAVPVGAMTLAGNILLEEVARYRNEYRDEAVAPVLQGFHIMQTEIDAYTAYLNQSTHTVQLQSMDPADLLADRDIVWTTNAEMVTCDATSAIEAAADLFHTPHDREEAVARLVSVHIPDLISGHIPA